MLCVVFHLALVVRRSELELCGHVDVFVRGKQTLGGTEIVIEKGFPQFG